MRRWSSVCKWYLIFLSRILFDNNLVSIPSNTLDGLYDLNMMWVNSELAFHTLGWRFLEIIETFSDCLIKTTFPVCPTLCSNIRTTSCCCKSELDQSGALSLVGRLEILLSLVESFIELKYFHSDATPALLCHKEPARHGIRDRWLPCTERSYYRPPYAIKIQRGSPMIRISDLISDPECSTLN